MGKKSKRQRPGKGAGSRREAILARRQNVNQLEDPINLGEETINLEDMRAKADSHREQFIRMTDDTSEKWNHACRFDQLYSYAQVFNDIQHEKTNDKREFATDQDRQFLKALCKSDMELLTFRAMGYSTRSTIYHLEFCFDDAVKCTQKAIQSCNQVSERERQQFGGSFHWLDTFQASLQDGLKCWRSIQFQIGDPETDRVKAVSCLGGDLCDLCSKTSEDGLTSFDCCPLCQMTYYCSRECQKMDWKQHKKVCRKPGEFEVGDYAYCGGPSKKIVSFEVRILAAEPGAKWLVCCKEDESKTSVVETKHLRRCRPALWHVRTLVPANNANEPTLDK